MTDSPRTADADATISGRRVLLLVGVTVVCTSTIVGALVGANWAERGAAVTVLGALSLPVSGGAVALYAAALSTLVVALLFAAVTVATRYDDAA